MIQLQYAKIKRKRIGKTQVWRKAREQLKVEYEEKGITRCEIGLVGCTRDNYLSFAHHYKRNDPRCEHTFEGTLICCISCHQKLEVDSDLTDYYFKKLR